MELFFNEDHRFIPDYDYWLNQAYWEFDIGIIEGQSGHFVGGEECLYLLMNLEPRLRNPQVWNLHNCVFFSLEFIRETSAQSIEFSKSISNISSTLERALTSDKIPHEYLFVDRRPEGKNTVSSIYKIKPAHLIKWALSINLRVAEPFLSMLESDVPKGTPPYLDPKHDAYSSELAACIKAWEAVYVDGKGDSGYSERTRIEMFIRDMYNKKPWERGTSTLDAALSSRLLTITTPDKDMKGGRKKKGPTHRHKK